MIGWVRVDAGIADDAKISQIAGLIGADDAKAIGHLVMLWAKMVNQAKDGDLSTVPEDKLEKWAGWSGRRGRFAKAVRSVLCDERGVMRAWERHNGAPIRKADADLARKNATRYGPRPGDDPASGRADVVPTVAPTVAPPGAGTRRTDETDETDEPTVGQTTTVGQSAREARLLASVTHEPDRQAVIDFLDRTPERERVAWAQRIALWLAGDELPAGMTPTSQEIATALRDYSGDFKPVHVRGFVLRIVKQRGRHSERGPEPRSNSAQARLDANRRAGEAFVRGVIR